MIDKRKLNKGKKGKCGRKKMFANIDGINKNFKRISIAVPVEYFGAIKPLLDKCVEDHIKLHIK